MPRLSGLGWLVGWLVVLYAIIMIANYVAFTRPGSQFFRSLAGSHPT